jgi:glycosyltransferase involved in cell wall biosynthesis
VTQRAIRICYIGNPESPHVGRWVRHFKSRGFDVTVLSYFSPQPGLAQNVPVTAVRGPSRIESGARLTSHTIPQGLPGLRRLVTAGRLKTGGFYAALAQLAPDIVHGHYASDYGFLAAVAGRHPLVVSAWGSDLLVDPKASPLVRRMVRWTLRRSDLVTYDANVLADAARELGARNHMLLRVVMGVDREFFAAAAESVTPGDRLPVIVSLRSLDRELFNVDTVIRAMALVHRQVPKARLQVGNDGRLRPRLERLAADLGLRDTVQFTGYTSSRAELARLLGRAAVYVSAPSSDGTSVTLLEAMACGAYPVVSDIPANQEWVDALGGELVPTRDPVRLADAMVRGLTDASRRQVAAARNEAIIRRDGLWDTNMARMESAYRELAAARSG